MPIRIKPIHQFNPCSLNLTSLKGICKLVDSNFNSALYSAEDGMWEIYREDSQVFLAEITAKDDVSGKFRHSKLDSFTVTAAKFIEDKDATMGMRLEKDMEIIFDWYQATVKFNGPPSLEDWFTHFMIDLRKNLLPPSFFQIVKAESRNFRVKQAPMLENITTLISERYMNVATYSMITLQEKHPNPLVENVKAGLITNLIWVIGAFIFGICFAVFAYWLWKNYGLNLYEWLTPPVIPATSLP